MNIKPIKSINSEFYAGNDTCGQNKINKKIKNKKVYKNALSLTKIKKE
ncbi:hypothetical protein [Escherichia coli]|nr:hypothetical protein [Escherichia coli]